MYLPELASKVLDGRDFVCLSFWCLEEGDLVLGRLTGTSSGVEQCLLLLMQPLYAVHRASHCSACAFSFQQLQVEASFTSGPFRLELLGCSLRLQSFRVIGSIFVTSAVLHMWLVTLLFSLNCLSTWNRNLTSQWTWKRKPVFLYISDCKV